MTTRQMIALISVFVGVLIGANSFYIVDEREKVILFQLGEITKFDVPPGIHFKAPFVQNIRRFDGRILTLDTPPDQFLTQEKKNVKVDFFVKWRIDDVRSFYQATSGDEAQAEDLLYSIVVKGLRNEFGTRTIQQAVSGERREMVEALERNAQDKVADLGIQVVDVRIKRIDLPDDVSDSVYSRMRSERQRVAKELRAQGAEEAERIRSDADRQREVLLAEAYGDAEKIRGAGDARAAEIYASAYGRDEEFYSFYRSLNVYREVWSGPEDVIILEPDSEFFKYFRGDRK